MIVSGHSRNGVNFFARHLLRADHNERVELVEMRGLMAENLPDALHEMQAVACGTGCKNFLYHCHINPKMAEVLTPAEWEQAVDIVERHLGLQGQSRVVIEHQKSARVHRHVVWSRIDPDTMTARHDGLNYRAHERAAREIETVLNLAPVGGALVRDKGTARPELTIWPKIMSFATKSEHQNFSKKVASIFRYFQIFLALCSALKNENFYPSS